MIGRKNLFILISVAAIVAICHGARTETPEAKELYDRLFKANQEPMSSSETIEGLERLQTMTKNENIKSEAQKFLDLNKFGINDCFYDYYVWLGILYDEYEYGESTEKTSVSNVAKLTKSQANALYDLCHAEYKKQLSEGLNSITDTELKEIDDIAYAVDDSKYKRIMATPSQLGLKDLVFKSLAKLVAEKARKDTLYSKSWGKLRLDREKFEQAYEKFVGGPCGRLDDTLWRTIKIGMSLENIKTFDEREVLLFKEERICQLALGKGSNDCFEALSKMQS